MALVVTNDEYYREIANCIRTFSRSGMEQYFGKTTLRPSEMASGIALLAEESLSEGRDAGYDEGYSTGQKDGRTQGMNEGLEQGRALCAAQHFVHTFSGDGSPSFSVHIPFEPDAIHVFGLDPTMPHKPYSLAEFSYDCRAFGLIAGMLTYGRGDGNMLSMGISSVSALTRYSRAEDGTVTLQNLSNSTSYTITYGSGFIYTLVAVKYTGETDKTRITDFVNGLTGSGTATLNRPKVSAAFSDQEWAALIARKPNYTFTFF